LEKVCFLTLGCKVNKYESDCMANILKQNGYSVTSNFEKADIYVVNTCAVTNEGSIYQSNAPIANCCGVTPMISVKIPRGSNVKSFLASLFKVKIKEDTEIDVGELKDVLKTIKKVKVKKGYAHTIQFGEYPTNRLFGEDNEEMEKAFDEHREEFAPTGRTFSLIGSDGTNNVNAIRLCPEFIYKGKKYVRALQNNFKDYYSNEDDDYVDINFSWVEVTPMTFYITNWDRLPTYINPTGSNKDSKMELLADKVYVGGMAYGIDAVENPSWESSNIRNFLDRGCYGKETSFIQEAFNLEREPITSLYLRGENARIPMLAFDSCHCIRKFAVDDEMEIDINAFDNGSGNQVRYFTYLEDDGVFVLCKEKPKNISEPVYDFDEMKKYLVNADIGQMKFFIQKPYLLDFYNRLKKEKTFFSLPLIYLLDYAYSMPSKDEDKAPEEVFNEIYLKHLKSLNPTLKTLIEKNEYDECFITCVYKVLMALGCTTDKKMLNDKGEETEVYMAQKAITLFEQINKRYELNDKNFYEMFDIDKITPTSQDCLNFLLHKDGNKLDNFDLIVNLQKNHKNLFNLLLKNFERLSQFRVGLSENGTPFRRSLENALIAFYEKGYYKDVTKETEDLADEFSSKLINESVFKEAVQLRKVAIRKGVPHHLLGVALKEDTILTQIEKIKENTALELTQSKDLLQETFNKEFTFEMLDKYDAKNPVIGLYADCCCTLTSSAYGKDIAESVVTSDDVQNMVVRNAKGEIIAKASMYLNRQYGYVVINDFEINHIYRKDEQHRSGRYGDEAGGKKDVERGKIFSAFMRGIHLFVKEYDKQNPDNPIKQVNVGMGYNRLKKYVEMFDSAKNPKYVPTEYAFADSDLTQYVLYDANHNDTETLTKNENLWKALQEENPQDMIEE